MSFDEDSVEIHARLRAHRDGLAPRVDATPAEVDASVDRESARHRLGHPDPHPSGVLLTIPASRARPRPLDAHAKRCLRDDVRSDHHRDVHLSTADVFLDLVMEKFIFC